MAVKGEVEQLKDAVFELETRLHWLREELDEHVLTCARGRRAIVGGMLEDVEERIGEKETT